MGIRIFIFLSGKLLYFFLGLCDYLDKFPKMFCSSCDGECPSTTNFCYQCGQQLNLSQVSNRAASSVDKEKLLLKEYFHLGYPSAAIVSLLGKRQGVRMHVRMLKVPLTLQLSFFGRFLKHLSRTHFRKNVSKILNPDFFTSA